MSSQSRMRRHGMAVRLCGAVLLMSCGALAQAAPFVVSSPSVSKAPKIKATFEDKDNGSKETITSPKLAYETPLVDGVLEFKIAAGYRRVERSGGSADAGLNDAEVKLKWAISRGDPARGIPAFGMEPELVLPTGDEDRGLGGGAAALEIPFILGWKLANTELGVEFGYNHDFGEDTGAVPLGVLGLVQVAPGLKVGVEMVGEAPVEHFDDYEVSCNLGFKWKLPHAMEIDGLYGRTTHTLAAHDTTKAKLVLSKSF